MKSLQKDQILKDYNAVKSVAYKYIRKKNYEKALRSIFVACGYIYTFSPFYCDDELEKKVQQIGKNIGIAANVRGMKNKNILFYDGFGNDRRGLSVIYVRALKELGYHVVYVTYEEFKDTIPQIKKYVEAECIFYVKANDFTEQMVELSQIINMAEASKALLYTHPEDVVGTGVFSQYKGVLQRFLINMTDHAFWLGKCSMDYVIEFRNYGANISYLKRKIDRSKIFLLPFYPNIPACDFKGLPFDDKGKKIIFSGGQLYKTYGKNNQYYKMVENILEIDSKTVFYYVGEGDRTEIDKLIEKYPYRVYCDKERNDFFEIMKKCYFYLSTYPYFGGLMTQFAVAAGKLPVTLASEELVGEQTIETNETWYFNDVETLYAEAKKLLLDERYLYQQQKKIKNMIIEPQQFTELLGIILSERKEGYTICWKKTIETDKVQELILDRTKLKEYYGLFCRVRAPFLLWKFPVKFLCGLIANLHEHKLKIKR